MRQLHADCCVCPVEAAEQECGGESQRHGDDRLVEISLVLVLMQRQSCTGVVPIDQTGVGYEFFETCLRRHIPGQREERLRHWPRQSALRVHRSKDLRTGSLSWACHYVASWKMMPTV